MKKIIAGIMAAMLFAMVMFMGAMAPASATGNTTPAENKQVTFCHATGVDGKYNKITTSLNSFINAGHVDHVQGGQKDIYEAITYTTKGGDTVTIPAQGNTALLAFDDCKAPAEIVKIAKPVPVYVDKCGTAQDTFAVTPGTGYTVGNTVVDGNTQSILVTANEGFEFLDGSKQVTFTKPVFTNVDCDLPETGGMETAVSSGIGALVALGLAGLMFMGVSRRKATN